MVLEPSELHPLLITAAAQLACAKDHKTAELLLKQPANDLLAIVQVSAFYPGLIESCQP